MNTPLNWTLQRNPAGRLVFTDAAGTSHDGVTPVRAFPLSAPDGGLSIVGPDGHELLWLDTLQAAPEPARSLLASELAVREFAPVVQALRDGGTQAVRLAPALEGLMSKGRRPQASVHALLVTGAGRGFCAGWQLEEGGVPGLPEESFGVRQAHLMAEYFNPLIQAFHDLPFPVVAAPSGTGKSSLVNALLELDSRVKPSVSHTTRQPRAASHRQR